ncbi:Protein of unknown function [Pyronema omphalodes CBS 100304]|uniref:Uncharacterized protein n=1 Tax=Pyronema omphalodes (strain CBS 100304) TaxID=1076935 RepID=U4LSF6_PYROM|nr:Protein of unknown function [Pyronema omphalodes CBS 100304]
MTLSSYWEGEMVWFGLREEVGGGHMFPGFAIRLALRSIRFAVSRYPVPFTRSMRN